MPRINAGRAQCGLGPRLPLILVRVEVRAGKSQPPVVMTVHRIALQRLDQPHHRRIPSRHAPVLDGNDYLPDDLLVLNRLQVK